MSLNVNGQAVTAEISANLSLLRFLREELRLTGAKDGCASGHCSACTVIVNGKAQRACLLKMGKLLKEVRVHRGRVDEAFARCAVVVEDDYTTPSVEHAYLEPEAGLALPDTDGGVTLLVPTQAAWDDRRELAAILALPREKVRVKQLPIGGAFGAKGDVHLHRFLALGALHTRRPVQMALTREESLRTHAKRHASQMHVRLGADAEGKLQAIQTQVVLDGGADASTSGGILEAGCVINTGPYFAPNLDLLGQVWYTNNIIGGAMRRFGSPTVDMRPIATSSWHLPAAGRPTCCVTWLACACLASRCCC